MANPFLAEIRIFPFNFPPKGWAFCDGQLMSISQNTALFSLLGTTYGGDGKSTFALPNLQGSAPMHPGQGPGLSLHDLGEQSGSDTITLLTSEVPNHQHVLNAASTPGNLSAPGPNAALSRSTGGAAYHASGGAVAAFATGAVGLALSGGPHNNLQPYLTLNFCIALQGVYPPRT